LLDRVGLIALWREGLLAQKVLLGKTKGYCFHPQPTRFRATKHPGEAIATYLWAVHAEATKRGYRFNSLKIASRKRAISLPVTCGQLAFELEHLARKLRSRDRKALSKMLLRRPLPHPMMRAVRGRIERWEIV
jgi:pyrimidine dimer DNA glycosylase